MRPMPFPIVPALEFCAMRFFELDSGPGAIVAVFFCPVRADQDQPTHHPDKRGLADNASSPKNPTHGGTVVCIDSHRRRRAKHA